MPLIYEHSLNTSSVDVLADKNRLNQVMYNLLINAFKFTRPLPTKFSGSAIFMASAVPAHKVAIRSSS